MHPEPNPYGPVHGPSGPKPRRRLPRVAVAAGATALLGLAGAGLALAVGGSRTPAASLSSTSQPTSPTTPPKPLHPRLGRGPMLGLGPGGGRILHGQYTIEQGGSYKTISVQSGQVVGQPSSTSLSVKSADGTTQTYSVQPSTIVDSQAGGISTVHTGDTVRVQALVQGKSYTATNIVDVTQMGASRRGFGLVPPASPSGAAGRVNRGPLAPPTAPA